MANRIVLPRHEANPENHPFHRSFRERRADSNRRGADRLSVAEPAAKDGARRSNPARNHATHTHEPHASKRLHKPQATANPATARPAATFPKLELNMNRTAVGQARP